MAKRYLLVGGAGFIGSHLADELLRDGHEARIYDSLVPQVHGRADSWPACLNAAVEVVHGDVRDAGGLARQTRWARSASGSARCASPAASSTRSAPPSASI